MLLLLEMNGLDGGVLIKCMIKELPQNTQKLGF